MNWLSQTDRDSMLSEDARGLAKALVEHFGTPTLGYVNYHDSEAAEILGVSVRTAAEARKELVSRGFLIPLAGRMSVPSFKLSTCRW